MLRSVTVMLIVKKGRDHSAWEFLLQMNINSQNISSNKDNSVKL